MCEVSDAGCATALVAGLMSHNIIASSCGLCVSVYVSETVPSVVISGSVVRIRSQGLSQGGAEVFVGAMRHRSKQWVASGVGGHFINLIVRWPPCEYGLWQGSQ